MKYGTVLMFVWVAAMAARLSLFTGYINGDMGNYIQEAYNFFNGGYSVRGLVSGRSVDSLVPGANFNWQNLRLGLIVPVGVLFKAFGVNDFSYALFSFLSFTIGYIVTYLLGRELASRELGVTAAAIFAFIPLEINLSTVLLPHLPAAAFMALSFLLALRSCRTAGVARAGYAVSSGAALGIAYLVWEFAMVFFPVVFILVVMESGGVRKSLASLSAWGVGALIMAGFLPLFILENAYFYHISGEIFFRSKFISATGAKWIELHPSDRQFLGAGIYPGKMFSSYYFGAFYYLAAGGLLLSALALILRKKGALDPGPMLLPAAWFALLFLYLEFGSASLKSYQPTYKLSHYLAVVSVPASLLASYLVTAIAASLRAARSGAAYSRQFPAAVVAAFAATSIVCSYANYAGNGPFRPDMTYEHRIKKELDRLNATGPVYTDLWTKHALDFVYGYTRPVLAFNSLDGSTMDISRIDGGYMVVNRIYLSSGHTMAAKMPDGLDNPAGWDLAAQIRGRNSTIDIYSRATAISSLRGPLSR